MVFIRIFKEEINTLPIFIWINYCLKRTAQQIKKLDKAIYHHVIDFAKK